MARLDKGLLGGYTGKLGTTVGSSWKGINVVRTYQPNVANPNSQAQQDQRSAFKQISQVASLLLGPIIKPFWDSKATKMSGYNAFIQANLLGAVKNGKIDPEKFILSQGRIGFSKVFLPTIYSNDITLTWTNVMPAFAANTDTVSYVAYTAEMEILDFGVNVALREDQGVDITLPTDFERIEYFVFSWRSADGKYLSDSQVQIPKFDVTP